MTMATLSTPPTVDDTPAPLPSRSSVSLSHVGFDRGRASVPGNCSTNLQFCLIRQALAPDRKAKSRNYSDPVPKRLYAPCARAGGSQDAHKMAHIGARSRAAQGYGVRSMIGALRASS